MLRTKETKYYKGKLDAIDPNGVGKLSSKDKRLLNDACSSNAYKSHKAKEKLDNKIRSVSGSVTIYAELSRKQLGKLSSGNCCLEFPYGTEVIHRQGSRVFNLTCENMEVAKELIEGLDASAISWQIV